MVKLADRLHNMRTLDYMPVEARRRAAEETLEIYAPLAGRMGMHAMREELDDLAFRELYPEAYEVVSGRLNALADRNKHLISEIEQQLTKKLADRGIDAKVMGRRKRAYSIWRKMERKSVGFEQLSDIFGFRVIVKTVADCYQALGIVHTTWPMVPGRYKDYISTPKANDYRSIHTTVIGPGKQRVELQIRTTEMHELAEYGIAAHALYKDSVGSPTEMLSRESSAYAWLRRTIELLAEGSNPEEFLEHTKLELFHDQVFCFTPKGKLIALAAQGDADRFRLCGAYRCRQHRGRLQDQWPDRAAWDRKSSTATKSRSSPRRRKQRRRRPGSRSWSPARRAPRSGAPPARRCARNIPGSAGASSSACSSAPRSPIRTRSLQARCRGWRGRRSKR